MAFIIAKDSPWDADLTGSVVSTVDAKIRSIFCSTKNLSITFKYLLKIIEFVNVELNMDNELFIYFHYLYNILPCVISICL